MSSDFNPGLTAQLVAKVWEPAVASTKVYSFGIYHRGEPVNVRIFDSEVYNHPKRYRVDIRHLGGEIMRDFRKVVGAGGHELTFQTAEATVEDGVLSFGGEYDLRSGETPLDLLSDEAFTEGYSVRLMVNDNPIIERRFAVYSGNRDALASVELTRLVAYWCERIAQHIKQTDIEYMYEEQYLQNTTRLSPREVRALDPETRTRLLEAQRPQGS